jgi:cytochrome oxidase Cu insertion factor (SCO1/SenC/PrrC family)
MKKFSAYRSLKGSGKGAFPAKIWLTGPAKDVQAAAKELGLTEKVESQSNGVTHIQGETQCQSKDS